jgi:hypothetical protein
VDGLTRDFIYKTSKQIVIVSFRKLKVNRVIFRELHANISGERENGTCTGKKTGDSTIIFAQVA